MVKKYISAVVSASFIFLAHAGQASGSSVTDNASKSALTDLRSAELIKPDLSSSSNEKINLSPTHPSFSALYRHHHQPSQTLLSEAQVLYSGHGVRVEQDKGGSGNIFIANFAEDKFWFVDQHRQLLHTLPVTISKDEFESSSSQPVMGNSAGFLQFSPCNGMEGKQGERDLWQGRIVQRWTCSYQGEAVEEQWFSPTLGVVVRSSTLDGYVSELTDVRERETRPHNFQPPSDYRSVSIEELMNPAIPIGVYIE
ncbi:hypothetical protein [Granulosicoccus antarcticus]|uniref:DUF4412 domain-containing protein n=1 Tax=Granulosicoccus antarcticus IMCC3135 TaxID=1192854 RepID=A0A2Z2NXG0_9GAMM|nr:hypothetical protein [Granulosicoccus antarcticus]ASJ74661.1 hypothetical protein IMCC3135_22955 [Granulosicoccus antarcticus IMCC3135]